MPVAVVPSVTVAQIVAVHLSALVRSRKMMKPAAKSDLTEFSESLFALRAPLIQWVYVRTGSWEQSEEIVQQALLQALEKQHQLKSRAALKPWFYQIVRHMLSDLYRHPSRELSLNPTDLERLLNQSVESHLEPAFCPCILNFLKALRPEDQQLMVCSLETPRIKEVAQQLGLSPNLVSVRLHRIRKTLRQMLKQTCGTDSVRSCQNCGCT